MPSPLGDLGDLLGHHAARRLHVRYLFLLMQASGEQLRAIAALVNVGTIRPVIDRVFAFESTKEAMAYVESGRAKGKVVVTMADCR